MPYSQFFVIALAPLAAGLVIAVALVGVKAIGQWRHRAQHR